MDSGIRARALLLVLATTSGLLVAARSEGGEAGKPASPIFGVTIPDGYRAWQLIAPALRASR